MPTHQRLFDDEEQGGAASTSVVPRLFADFAARGARKRLVF
jgi:hypothetical protein